MVEPLCDAGGLKLNVTDDLDCASVCPIPLQMAAPVDGDAKVEPVSESSRKPLKLDVPDSVSVVAAVVLSGPGADTVNGWPLVAGPWPPEGPEQSPGWLLKPAPTVTSARRHAASSARQARPRHSILTRGGVERCGPFAARHGGRSRVQPRTRRAEADGRPPAAARAASEPRARRQKARGREARARRARARVTPTQRSRGSENSLRPAQRRSAHEGESLSGVPARRCRACLRVVLCGHARALPPTTRLCQRWLALHRATRQQPRAQQPRARQRAGPRAQAPPAVARRPPAARCT